MTLSTKVLWGSAGCSSKSRGPIEQGQHVSEGRHGKFKSGAAWRASGGRQSRLKTGWVEGGSDSSLGMDLLSGLESLHSRSSQGEELAGRSGPMHSLVFLNSRENHVLLIVITEQLCGNGQLTLHWSLHGFTTCSFPTGWSYVYLSSS